jgi:hypothetical protein
VDPDPERLQQHTGVLRVAHVSQGDKVLSVPFRISHSCSPFLMSAPRRAGTITLPS